MRNCATAVQSVRQRLTAQSAGRGRVLWAVVQAVASSLTRCAACSLGHRLVLLQLGGTTVRLPDESPPGHGHVGLVTTAVTFWLVIR